LRTKIAYAAIAIYRWAEVHATSRNLVLGGLLWLSSVAGLIALQVQVVSLSGGLTVPDVVPFYGSHQLFDLLERYGEAGRRAFLRFALYDVFYPFVAYGFALLLIASLARPFAMVRVRWAYLALLPLAGLVVEILEQAGFVVILLLFPGRLPALGWALAALSSAKLLLLGGLLLALLALATARVALRVRRPTRRCGFTAALSGAPIRRTAGRGDVPSSSFRTSSSTWVWLFPPTYLAHLIDERCFGIGTADFATQYLGIYFTNSTWLAVNAPSFLVLTVSTWLVVRGRWPGWITAALGTHLALHGLVRVPTSVWFGTVAPGLLTGLGLCVPLAGFALFRGHRRLSRSEFRIGILVGFASFQPFWHFLLLPVLPRAPVI
jgi:hypothetical protein